MIKFMILGLPRSGTTWTTVWLEMEGHNVIHDPLNKYHYDELDDLAVDGIVDTGLYLFPEWLNEHPAKKVILHRDRREVITSMTRIRREFAMFRPERLDKIDGLHLPWRAIFDEPERIYNHLFETEFDVMRHARLKEFKIEPNQNVITADRNILRRLQKDSMRKRAEAREPHLGR
jgi:hypothetical protein